MEWLAYVVSGILLLLTFGVVASIGHNDVYIPYDEDDYDENGELKNPPD